MKGSKLKDVLLVTHRHLPFGTADRVAHHLASDGHHITFMEHPLLPSSEQTSKMFSQSCMIKQAKRNSAFGIRYVRDFFLTRQWCNHLSPDVAIGFDALSAYSLVRTYYGRSTKVILYLVDWSDKPVRNYINQMVCQMVDEVWCVSKAIQSKLGRPDVRVVPNLPLQFMHQPSETPEQLSHIRIGYIGHLTDEQDITPFLYALALIQENNRPSLLIAGEGPMYSKYIRICHELGLNRVELIGPLRTEKQLSWFYQNIQFGIVSYHSNEKIANGDSIKLADYITNYKFVLTTYPFEKLENQGLGEYMSRDPNEIAGIMLKLPKKKVNPLAACSFWEERRQKFYDAFH